MLSLSRSSSDIVKVELEAAEALAGLARSSVVIETQEPASRQRVKDRSPVAQYPATCHPLEPVPPCPDHARDQAVVVRQHGDMAIQTEQDDELRPNHVGSSTNYIPSIGSKLRQNLNEAEKEARRVRRVLANRESARQTIRRRQAFHEELARKAADLAWENENLKKEKEVAMKEYDSLRSTNESLKAQITNKMKVEAHKTRDNSNSSNTVIATSPSTRYPVYVYNQPSLFPFFWPPIIPSSNVVQLQCVPQNGIAIPPQVSVPASDEPYSCHEQGNVTRMDVSATPFYVLPCPWLPFSHPDNGIQTPSFDLSGLQKQVIPSNEPRGGSSSISIAHVNNHQGYPSMLIMTEASSSAECIPASSLHENPSAHSPEGGGQLLGCQSRGGGLVPPPLGHVRPTVTVADENISWAKHSCRPEGTSAAGGYHNNGEIEINQEPVVSMSKKQVDIVVAAEARKRRKELKKLKNLQSRQLRTSHC